MTGLALTRFTAGCPDLLGENIYYCNLIEVIILLINLHSGENNMSKLFLRVVQIHLTLTVAKTSAVIRGNVVLIIKTKLIYRQIMKLNIIVIILYKSLYICYLTWMIIDLVLRGREDQIDTPQVPTRAARPNKTTGDYVCTALL